jgi:hypothetical protein
MDYVAVFGNTVLYVFAVLQRNNPNQNRAVQQADRKFPRLNHLWKGFISASVA